MVGNPDLHGLHIVQDQEHIPDHIFVLNEDRSFSMDSHHFTDTVEGFAASVYPQVFAREEKAAEEHPPEPEEDHSH